MSTYRESGSVVSRSTKVGAIIAGLVVVLGILAILVFPSIFGYALHTVDATQIGLKIHNGQVEEILGPNIYSDPFAFFTDITNVNISGINFLAQDPEVLTKDFQRIGVQVSGQVFRPGLATMNKEMWTLYRNVYINDTDLATFVQDQAKQAMKVCVGDRTFEQAAVGTSRNDLRVCIDEELTNLTSNVGLVIQNLVVPDIGLSDQSKQNLDALTNSRQQTALAEQDAKKAVADAARDLAVSQGQIQVQQGQIQEQLRQEAISADLERKKIEAQQAVIEAQKANELLTAQKNLEIAQSNLAVSQVDAQAKTAEEVARAKVIESNPAYGMYLQAIAYANALKDATLTLIPDGSSPFFMFGNGQNPSISVPVK